MNASHHSHRDEHGMKRNFSEMSEGRAEPAPLLRRITMNGNSTSPAADVPKISRKIRACMFLLRQTLLDDH